MNTIKQEVVDKVAKVLEGSPVIVSVGKNFAGEHCYIEAFINDNGDEDKWIELVLITKSKEREVKATVNTDDVEGLIEQDIADALYSLISNEGAADCLRGIDGLYEEDEPSESGLTAFDVVSNLVDEVDRARTILSDLLKNDEVLKAIGYYREEVSELLDDMEADRDRYSEYIDSIMAVTEDIYIED